LVHFRILHGKGLGRATSIHWERCRQAGERRHPRDLGVPQAGEYDVRVTWQPHENRAKQCRVVIKSGTEVREVKIDQTQNPRGEKSFAPLGTFRFDPNQPATIEFLVGGSQGVVHIDRRRTDSFQHCWKCCSQRIHIIAGDSIDLCPYHAIVDGRDRQVCDAQRRIGIE
jgi:hypothetical protein